MPVPGCVGQCGACARPRMLPGVERPRTVRGAFLGESRVTAAAMSCSAKGAARARRRCSVAGEHPPHRDAVTHRGRVLLCRDASFGAGVPAMRRPAKATSARAAKHPGAAWGTRPADPVGIRRPGGCMSPLARPWGRGWRGERGGLGAPRVRLAGAGAGARGPRPRGALGRDAAADGVAWKTACSVRTVSTGLPGTSTSGTTRLTRTRLRTRSRTRTHPVGKACSPTPNTTPCGPRTFPRPGVCSRSPSGPAGGYRPAGAGAPDPVPRLGGAVTRSG